MKKIKFSVPNINLRLTYIYEQNSTSTGSLFIIINTLSITKYNESPLYQTPSERDIMVSLERKYIVEIGRFETTGHVWYRSGLDIEGV